MTEREEARRERGGANPFGSLIAASWIVVAVLYVAGFSYRWSYYYNFGVQHLVLQQSVQSFLIAAIELVRQPGSAGLTILYVLLPLVLLNTTLALLTRAYGDVARSRRHRTMQTVIRVLGLDSAFLRDALRAVVLLYGCYMVSSEIGSAAFRRDVVDSPFNVLPRVTVLFHRAADETAVPLGCGIADLQHVQVIGDAEGLAALQETLSTCNTPTRRWRLLYRDENFVYVFAAQPADIIAGARPLTIVVPNDPKTFLVMQ
jgi:hypothetical protein